MNSEMPLRPLGRTGERVSAIGLGGWHLAPPAVDESLCIRIVRTAIDRGIHFLDNSWDYNAGNSEIRMGGHDAMATAMRLFRYIDFTGHKLGDK